ncbi:PTS sugar transporter subunit IIA [Bifidobacterium sp. ESL0775]|uniref:PTS sugar transporter subunit IIA n=1 Tax=Bifidobacterium sp. ESL0775 TaxID=2983230 RepID=UPI0023F62367|nr:PTS sugar transporter subunit IIA [Bifidobacterium sp. ESL0775]WEV69219.1 PTS sugar transporter subunit IIA [Bifidobacterium sp. ESL0775]
MKCLIEWEPASGAVIKDKPSLFAWFADFAWKHGLISERESVAGMLESREYEGDTLLAANLANPHIQGAIVTDTAMVFLKLANPCAGWGSMPHVSRVLFTLIPKSAVARDIAPLKNLYYRLADESVMRRFCTEGRREVESILRADEAT